MGFFDRFSSGKSNTPPPAATPTGTPAEKPAVGGGILPQLAAARVKLEARDLAGARALYEEVLATAGARPDVLVTISGDLGVHGHLADLIDLVAPRYDAGRHGPATGLNLLQAYLATRNVEAAQHLLDILFALQRPELEERLFGFSNALADIMAGSEHAAGVPDLPAEDNKVSMASISKPIWFYGLEEFAPHLLPRKEGKLRRVAFAQCTLPGLADAAARSARPEDDLGRLCRGLPLWLADTFTFSAGYASWMVVGTIARHYALFPMEWVAENIRQLNESSEGGFDYILTSALKNRNDDYELVLRIWEVKKFRELKAFTVRWTPATADATLLQFSQQVRQYMEWSPLPERHGLPASEPAAPMAQILGLADTLTQFLGEKGVLAPEQVAPGTDVTFAAARANPDDPRAQLNLITALLRGRAQGREPDPAALAHARAWLASPGAQAADASALALKLA